MVKPWAGWGRHTSCELWRTVCKVPRCVNLQQGCGGSWYRTAARSSLGHHVWVRVSSVTWELHTQGCVAGSSPWLKDNIVPLRVRGNSWMRQSGIPPACVGSITRVCVSQPQSGAPCQGFSGRAINAHPYSTAAASHQHPWKRNWLHCGKDVGVFTSAPQLVVIIILFSSYL